MELIEKIYQGKEKAAEAQIEGLKLEKLSNFGEGFVHCVRGRPLETLIGAVKDYLETLKCETLNSRI